MVNAEANLFRQKRNAPTSCNLSARSSSVEQGNPQLPIYSRSNRRAVFWPTISHAISLRLTGRGVNHGSDLQDAVSREAAAHVLGSFPRSARYTCSRYHPLSRNSEPTGCLDSYRSERYMISVQCLASRRESFCPHPGSVVRSDTSAFHPPGKVRSAGQLHLG